MGNIQQVVAEQNLKRNSFCRVLVSFFHLFQWKFLDSSPSLGGHITDAFVMAALVTAIAFSRGFIDNNICFQCKNQNCKAPQNQSRNRNDDVRMRKFSLYPCHLHDDMNCSNEEHGHKACTMQLIGQAEAVAPALQTAQRLSLSVFVYRDFLFAPIVLF